ncbi:DUF4325 domain-containing protein, partial [bacterium]|nr:DUF4325 domain-containing protein [bacterium]
MDAIIQINIAKDFTRSPGGRKKEDGDFSGEEFREKFLEPAFEDRTNTSKIRIIMDGCYGFPTSFLEESFGGLARKYGKKDVINRIELISEEEPLLIEEIISYINA